MPDILLPTTIEIGCSTYTIRTDAQASDDLRYDGDAGQCDYRQQVIKLCCDGRMAPGRWQRTVLHELIHASSYEYHRNQELTESQVDAVASGLAQVFKQLGISFIGGTPCTGQPG